MDAKADKAEKIEDGCSKGDEHLGNCLKQARTIWDTCGYEMCLFSGAGKTRM